jgi:hypothetical protein
MHHRQSPLKMTCLLPLFYFSIRIPRSGTETCCNILIQMNKCKTWGFHGGDYAEWCLSHLVFLRSVRRLLVTANVVPSSPSLVTLMKEALSSSETSVLTRATRFNIPEDTILQMNKHCKSTNWNSRTLGLISLVPEHHLHTSRHHTEIIQCHMHRSSPVTSKTSGHCVILR